jgi:adenosylmethionine-8-amino-7-oxononanoate aminotransferase
LTHLLKKFPNDPLPPSVKFGEGCNIVLTTGERLLDFTGGWTAHNVLGYGDKDVIEAMTQQLNLYPHIDGNVWTNPLLEELAAITLQNAPEGLDKVFFGGCNGSDAIEAAMKLSYHVHHDSGHKSKTKYIYREQSFSGSTLHALSVSDIPILNFYDPIKPSGFIRIPEHNYLHCASGMTKDQYLQFSLSSLEDAILKEGPDNIAAFVGETIMGSLRGEIEPLPGYWKGVRSICDKYNIHVILDEIYCGMSRSGEVFCCSYDDFVPDFICIGKAAAGGYAPVSAVVTKSKFERIIANGTGRIQLGHTFSGYSVGAAAMYATQRKVQNPAMLARIKRLGHYIRSFLYDQLHSQSFFVETRGRGLNSAIEYCPPNKHAFSLALAQNMRERHQILINSKWHRTTFTPAFVIDQKDVERVLTAFVQEFRSLALSWTGEISTVKMPRALGGVAPGA